MKQVKRSSLSNIGKSNRVVSNHSASKLFSGLKGVKWRLSPRTKEERESFSIREAARELEHAGWSVKAETAGYEPPKLKGLRIRPDIVATHGNSLTIVEVKAGNSSKEIGRIKQLRAYAKRMPNVSLQVIDAAKPIG